jgi:hypothetical protein
LSRPICDNPDVPLPAPVERQTSLGDRAADDLRFIRDAMARTSTFSAVPGVGGAVMGVIGLAAALAASRQPSPDRWLAVWIAAATLAFGVGIWAIVRKATRAGLPLTGPTPRNFAIGVAAPLAAGAAITFALWSTRTYTAMPGVWLLLYGAGVLTGGVFSVPVVRLTGALFMLFGFAAVVTPPAFGDFWLGAGFGVLQLGGGIVIARRHGG